MNAAARHPQYGKPLCRDDLENGASLRAAYVRSELAGLAWSDEQLERSLTCTLAQVPEGDVWVFAYGSLIWNPLFPYAEKRIARIYGLHRSFCLWSRINRGTPDRPGLVLGLDRGGSCMGLAYRIAGPLVREELRLLWRREMLTGAYLPTWVRARTQQGAVSAIAFVMNQGSPAYAGRLDIVEAARRIAAASGLHGPCAEYLVQTSRGLREHGIEDRTMRAVEAALTAL